MLTAAAIEGRLLFPLSELLGSDVVPDDVADLDRDTDSFLNSVCFTDSSIQPVENGFLGTVVLVILEEIVIAPFGDVAGLVIGGGAGVSVFEARVRLQHLPGGFRFEIGVHDVAVGLRISPSILRPLKPGTDDPEPPDVPLDVQLGAVSIVFGTDEPFSVAWSGSPSIPRCMIGESGVIVSAGAIRWLTPSSEDLSPDTPSNFVGLYLDDARVELSGLDLENDPLLFLDYAFIGRGGFSGRIDLLDLNLKGELAGFAFELRDFGLTLVQNSITTSNITGRLILPFFDAPLDVVVGISLDGGFALAISSPGGLMTLTRPGVLELQLESVGLLIDRGQAVLTLSGVITPLVDAVHWPGFRIQRLSIDSEGHVRLDGGWMDLREGYTIDFHGFQLELTKIGFGNTADGGKWMGFTGAVKLVQGLSAGASIEGLRITWYEDGSTDVSLKGVGVELRIPNVLRFKGTVSYDSVNSCFIGAVKLHLLALDMQIDGTLVAAPDHFAIYVAADLPAGIPLFSTGLAVYGMKGLLALDMEPNRKTEEPWYESPDGQPGWYKREPIGVANLIKKWQPQSGSMAFGAGVTLGTIADNGFTFSGRTLLLIVFPGPVLLIEGEANLLRERDAEPTMRALAVIDNRAGNFLVGLDAHYTQAEKGELIDISGNAQASFDFHRADAWNVHLGEKDPLERRIRAKLFQLFEANAYVALDAGKLGMGAWIGFEEQWQFGPLGLTLEAWMDANAVVSIRPAHFYGDLWLHGKVQASALGIGIGIQADARLQADVFDPFHIKGDLGLSVDLPWPFPDFDVSVAVEWGPNPVPPPLLPPLQDVAIEHFKVTTTWPLPRVSANGTAPLLLSAAIDMDGDGVLDAPLPGEESAARTAAPEVPLDARPHITFARPVHDRALAGVNAQAVYPEWERVGDPAKNEGPVRVRYTLERIALHKRAGDSWMLAARTRAGAGQPQLYGSWAPVPRMPSGGGENPSQVKLWLWSKTPFDYTRHAGRGWDEWFDTEFPSFPCQSVPEAPPDLCCTTDALDRFPVTTGSISNWVGPMADPWGAGISLFWQERSDGGPVVPVPAWVVKLDLPVSGLTRKLVLPARGNGNATELLVRLAWIPRPVRDAIVQIRLARRIPFIVGAIGHTADGSPGVPLHAEGFDDLVELRTSGSTVIDEVTLSYDFNHIAATTPPADIEVLSVTFIRDGEPLTLTMERVSVLIGDDWKCPAHPLFVYKQSRDSRLIGTELQRLATFIDVVRAPGRVVGFGDALLIRAFVVEPM